MALLIDGQVNTTEDLRNIENGILDLASTENIDLTGKSALAQDDLSTEILYFLMKRSGRDPKAFPYVFPGESLRRKLGISDVTVTPELKRWHALRTLQLAYSDAYSNQLNDRYAGKAKQYQERAKEAALSVFEIGVGISLDPLSRAMAPHLDSVSGVGAATTFFVQATLTNQAGQEGAPSGLASYTTVNNTQLRVQAVAPPDNSTGWNVYAGNTSDDVKLQHSVPLPRGTSWIVPIAGLQPGRTAGGGQTADRYVVNERTLLRG